MYRISGNRNVFIIKNQQCHFTNIADIIVGNHNILMIYSPHCPVGTNSIRRIFNHIISDGNITVWKVIIFSTHKIRSCYGIMHDIQMNRFFILPHTTMSYYRTILYQRLTYALKCNQMSRVRTVLYRKSI